MWGYSFPPFGLIRNCLSKIRLERSDLVLICPYWPSQPWFPLLLEMACDLPKVLISRPDLLNSCREDPHPLVTKGSICLTAWKLSGDASISASFRKKLSTSSWRAIGKPHALRISQPGTVGTVGAQRSHDPLSSDLNMVLSFLAHSHAIGKAYRTVNVYRSMLSMTLPRAEGVEVGKHPLVVKLMRGAFNSNPPSPRYETIWDVNVVLQFVGSLPVQLGKLDLAGKTACLLAMATYLRISELAAIDLPRVRFSSSEMSFSWRRYGKPKERAPCNPSA